METHETGGKIWPGNVMCTELQGERHHHTNMLLCLAVPVGLLTLSPAGKREDLMEVNLGEIKLKKWVSLQQSKCKYPAANSGLILSLGKKY